MTGCDRFRITTIFPEVVIFLTTFGFLIGTFASSPPRSGGLLAILLVIISSSGLAAFLRYKVRDDVEAALDAPKDTIQESQAYKKWHEAVTSEGRLLTPTKRNLLLLHAPSIALCVLLVGRLFATENFQAHPVNLDFGPKYGFVSAESDGTLVYEPNIAFTPHFNSFGHSIQGVLASFLSFPAVSGYLCRKLTTTVGGKFAMKRAIPILLFLSLVSSLMAIYPIYNLIKRVFKNGRTFATTSFLNNAMEWAMGYLIGVSVGLLVTVLVRRQLLLVLPKDHDGGAIEFAKQFEVIPFDGNNDDSSSSSSSSDNSSDSNDIVVRDPEGGQHRLSKDAMFGFGKPEEYEPTMTSKLALQITKAISNIVLLVFAFNTLLGCIFMGLSWNKCREEDLESCVNSRTNGNYIDKGILIFLFIMMYVTVLVIFYFTARKKYD